MAKKPKKTAAKRPPPPPPAALNIFERVGSAARSLKPAHLYATGAVLILIATCLLWSILGARLQQSNSDQLANPYIFESLGTTHQATLPSAHSFLLKWPLFFLVKLFGYTSASFIAVTVFSVLATVGILTYILYRIEHRPLYFGTLALALASVLMLVPAVPAAGALLPVNMAMLATRNLEYAVYIGALVLFIRARRMRDWRFYLACIVLGILVASDKLFLILPLSASLVALIIYSIRRKWQLTSLSSSWLVGATAAGLLGFIILGLINASGLTHISSGGSGLPYGLITSGKDLALGILYAGMGLATNFGANPAYDSTIVRNIPHQFFDRLFSLSGPAYFVNIIVLLLGLGLAYRLMRTSLSEKETLITDRWRLLSLALIWSSIAAVGVFIFSNHYYAVDARYLTIGLFALFISSATVLRRANWRDRNLAIIGGFITIGLCFGIVAALRTYNTQAQALAPTNDRNSLVAQALINHPVDTLVGDYWRVLPIRAISGNSLGVTPLQDCTTPRQLLSSQQWQPNLNTHSFAYLLSLDGSLTNYPQCNLNQVLAKYGHPNSSILIAGSLSQPKELLLLYDHGIDLVKKPKTNASQVPPTVLPLDLANLTNTSCSVPTDMNIVAHQDDDLLFMNPDVSSAIKQGDCVRTIYLTAGDAGGSKFYWLGREQGSEAAYSAMLGKAEVWTNHIIKITNSEFITIANPRGNTSVSLIFVHLPDGGIKGAGFPATSYESLQKLIQGKIKTIQSVDGQSSYSQTALVALLTSLMHVYQPARILTQANYVSQKYPDHSDHMAVGSLVKLAYAQYEQQQFNDQVSIPISFYIGYPVHGMSANLSDGALRAKEAIFLAYAKFDSGVCQTAAQCGSSPTYGSYLDHEVINAY